ncbi:MAG: dienelactone hydrolase family protein [Sulfuritalea sp.]|nr:dienelactone hydrolase family protein [Sulfuritalea sp.]
MNKSLVSVVAGVLLLSASAVVAQTQVSIPSMATQKPAVLNATMYTPEGPGPFPAIVLAHGCNGIGENVKNWANFLRTRGYMALILDSLTTRSISEVCTAPRLTPIDRAGDAFGALKYLQSQANVDKNRIGLMGFSHGAVTVLAALSETTPFPLGDAPQFAAATALYPNCLTSEVDVTVPLLIQSGERDDWSAAAPCQANAAARKNEGYPVEIEVYPNALHGFDDPAVQHYYGGSWPNLNKPKACCGASVGYNAAALAKAEQATEQFFAKHLKSVDPKSKVAWSPKAAPTRDEVANLVKAAKALAMTNGKNKLIELITSQDSQFRKRRVYLTVIDKQGIVLAHGRLPVAAVGADYSTLKDIDGRPLLNLIQSTLDQNPPWTSLRTAIVDADIYVERLDNDIIIIGLLMK